MPQHKNIPYGHQSIDAVDRQAVAETLASEWITQGPKIQEFEQALAKYCGAKYAVAVSSGTAALHLAALAGGLKKGDEAITTPITFLATSNALLYAGATPVFADIDEATGNIDPGQITKRITRRTKAILPVHFGGLPARMKEIPKIARRHGLLIIEDAAHALGAAYVHGAKVGSCRFSDMTVFSFHPVKNITTGEGGAITTNRKDLYEKLKTLRSHGVIRSKQSQRQLGGWYYEMRELGFNYRITDFQCALGLTQLRKLDSFIRKRQQVVRRYETAFKKLKEWIRVPAQKMDGEKHARHLYLLRLHTKRPMAHRRALYDALKAAGIQSQVHYIPVYWQPFYRNFFRGEKIHCPNAERYYAGTLSLPLFPGLTTTEINRTIHAVQQFFLKGKL